MKGAAQVVGGCGYVVGYAKIVIALILRFPAFDSIANRTVKTIVKLCATPLRMDLHHHIISLGGWQKRKNGQHIVIGKR